MNRDRKIHMPRGIIMERTSTIRFVSLFLSRVVIQSPARK